MKKYARFTALLNQSGIAPLIIVLAILFLSVAVVGGSYYIKNYTQIFKSQASETKVEVNQQTVQDLKKESLSPIASSTPTPANSIQAKGKLLFANHYALSTGKTHYFIYDLDAERKEPLLPQLADAGEVVMGAVSTSDGTKLAISTMQSDKVASANIDEASMNFYICSNPCTDPQKIDKQKVEAKLSQKNWWMPGTWVANSTNKLLLTSFAEIPVGNTSYKTELSVLDTDTYEVSSLLTDDLQVGSDNEFFLSTQADLLIVKNQDKSGKSIVSTYTLADNKRLDYPSGIIENFHAQDMNVTGGFGAFYVQSAPNESLGNFKTLEIKSIKNQNIGIAVLPADLATWHFNSKVYWSRANNLFGVSIEENGKLENTTSKLLIYTKEGTLVGSVDLDLIDLAKGKSEISRIEGVIFTADEKKLLISTYNPTSQEWKWQTFPVGINTSREKEYNGPDLGIPILWSGS